MTDWSQEIVAITGATSGIGAACSKIYTDLGAKVIAIGRRADRLREMADRERNILPVTLDIRERESVSKAINDLPADFRDITVLINNAGLALGIAGAQNASLDDWDVMIDTNIKGLTYCTHTILPGMVARNRGHIVNVGSVAGNYPYPGGNVYGGTKAFVHQFSLNLRADLLGTMVRVTSFEPAMTKTEFATVRFHGDDEKGDLGYQGMTPATAEEMAGMIHYATDLPPHLNINRLEVMPVQQAFAGYAFARREE